MTPVGGPLANRSVQINFRVNFPMIFIVMVMLHLLILSSRKPPLLKKIAVHSQSPRRPLQIKNLKTLGAKASSSQNAVYLNKDESSAREIRKERFSPLMSRAKTIGGQPLDKLSMRDLSLGQSPSTLNQRPGQRPELTKKNLSAINLRGPQLREFSQEEGSTGRALRSIPGQRSQSIGGHSGDPRAGSLSNTDIMVNLEVPEGVNPDELNKFELMFYSFQRRTAINYVNSFFKNLNRFQLKHPSSQFPMTDLRQVMTGRLTYDDKGNIKQIKMLKWTNVTELQDFFLDVLKDMDTLHNPPRALWEGTGEFSIVFNLVVND